MFLSSLSEDFTNGESHTHVRIAWPDRSDLCHWKWVGFMHMSRKYAGLVLQIWFGKDLYQF
jgi:hypothetical protein